MRIAIDVKRLYISTDETSMDYRRTKVKICDPSGTNPGMVQMTADGLKVLFPVADPRVGQAVNEVKSQLEGRGAAGTAEPTAAKLKICHPAPPSARSIVQKSKGSVGRVTQGAHRTPPTPAVINRGSGSGSSCGSGKKSTSERRDQLTLEDQPSLDITPQMRRPLTDVSPGSAERRTSDSLASLHGPDMKTRGTPMQRPLDHSSSAYKLLCSPSVTVGQEMCAARRIREQQQSLTPHKTSPMKIRSPPHNPSPPLTIDAVSKVQRFFTTQRKAHDLSSDGAVSRFQGIGNIGNSCYMNSVLQVCFPVHRALGLERSSHYLYC